MTTEQDVFRLQSELDGLYKKLWCQECDVPYGVAMFSDRDLLKLVEKGRIRFDPMPNLTVGNRDSDLGTCKIDLHLGKEALIADSTRVPYLDLSESIPEEYFTRIDIQKRGKLVVPPGSVIIATTLEKLTLADDLFSRMEGKSGVARKGGAVQLAAVFDAGWDGYPAMELHNITNTPLIVHF